MFRLAVVASCIIACVAGASQAGVLDDTVVHFPWVKSNDGEITYTPITSTTGMLDMVSYPTMYNHDAGTVGTDLTDGYLNVHVIVDLSTKSVSWNTAYDSALYLTGNPDGGDVVDMFKSNRPVEFDYYFANQGQIALRFLQDGAMQPPNNGNVVVQIWAAGASDFNTLGDVTALYSDTFFMPEPCTLALLAVGGLVLARRRRMHN